MTTFRLALLSAGLVGLVACDDHLFPSGHGGGPIEGEGWCATRDLFAAQCTSCHGGAALGGLDLEADPAAALIGVESANYPGSILVDPGSPSTSLLYLKLTDAQGALGTEMPPASGGVEPGLAAVVEAWILEGASTVCDGDPPPPGYHPPGYGQPGMHGQEAKLQVQDCTECHGERLEGGEALTCASQCHGGGPDWASNCQWCHGSDESGLPPEDIDDSAPTDVSFPGHGAHVRGQLAVAYDCTQCHAKPTDAFSPGHLFVDDDTPAVAEVTFAAMSFPDGAGYAGGTCTVYCHGPGTGVGAVSRTDARAPGDCGFCHGGAPGGGGLSAPHDKHLEELIPCATCHPTAVGVSGIADPTRHVDGTLDLELPPEIQRVGGLCTGTCHGEPHTARPWADD